MEYYVNHAINRNIRDFESPMGRIMAIYDQNKWSIFEERDYGFEMRIAVNGNRYSTCEEIYEEYLITEVERTYF